MVSKDNTVEKAGSQSTAPFNSFVFDGIEGDLHHLAILLDYLVSEMQSLDHTNPNGQGRHVELERCDALAWIARDTADKIAKDISAATSDFAKVRKYLPGGTN